MTLISWCEDYSIHIKELDDEHKKFFSIINELHESMINPQLKVSVEHILVEVLSHCDSHFETEEAMMKEINYDDYSRHKVNHDAFRRRVLHYLEEARSGRPVLRTEVMNTLKNWMATHIMVEDKRSGEFICRTREL